MKKFFEEPSIECIRLYSESIADAIGDGNTSTEIPSEGGNYED